MTAFQQTGHFQSHRSHSHKCSCMADIGFTAEEIEQFTWGMRGLYQQLPPAGPGYECYEPAKNCYGLPEVIQAIQYVCTEWHKLYPNGPRVGIGDISYQGGGYMPPHQSHQHGLDVDVALVASNHEEIPLTYYDAKYSRQRTQQLIDLFQNNPILGIRVIFFNDPDVYGVEYCAGHDNHFHVSFLSAGVSAAPYSSDQIGDLRLVVPPMQGERVRKLQADLAKAGIDVGVDGIFGKQTDAAVRQFQSQQGLEIDGIAGAMTQARLAKILRDQPTARGGSEPVGLKLQDIIDQNKAIPFEDVNASLLVEDQRLCTEIQTILRVNGLLEVVDGLYGPKTREALRRFKDSRHLGGGDVLGATTARALLDSRPGMGSLPDWQGGDKQATIQAIIQEARRQGITSKAQIAYILATAQHETADSFQPVREGYFLGEPNAEIHRQSLRYSPYYGRGYVQLTWDYNYRQYSDILGIDLVNEPDLVMRPDISLFILVDGMKRGVFTGVKLDDYISEQRIDYYNARRIINWIDQAERIATHANDWQTRLA
ncbi:MAG: penicillin-insensitive murein endopeptidase [Elainella sp. C42_A2020_010]|nr:penicillin-insensitive murein endopeptidase [Elainella sp. C42_A2020_010]RNJ69930.1 MAG: peptidoglycan-binding protein [Leptolyngbya sp. IPPAS B-1204]